MARVMNQPLNTKNLEFFGKAISKCSTLTCPDDLVPDLRSCQCVELTLLQERSLIKTKMN